MKKFFLLATLFATTVCNAQTVLWDGEDESVTSRNQFGGWWDRGNPSVVENPEKDGINTSEKCLKFTMTGNDFGQKHVALPFRDWMTPDLQGNRRFSFMIKKAQNENVKVEVSDPTNGANNYWEKTAAWYGGAGKWQKVVLDFSTNVNMNDYPGVFAIEAQTVSVDEPQDVYIDNVVIEPMPMVSGKKLADIEDNSLTGNVVVTGSLMRGDCQNANDNWFRVDYDDFAILKDKLAATAVSLDLRGVILKDQYFDQIQEKCPEIKIILTDDDITGIQAVTTAPQVAHTYFDLQGRRVAHPENGLYILHGKKVVLKK
ncbi:MAG: hypothetical protein IJ144_03070 [Prevotella sp.]|nr:hypothetical protein [Prevotella sp.]MBQ9186791.1 hypothetical protein [Prevotella sp.]